MSQFRVDYSSLIQKPTYKLSQVKHLLEKVAFDIVRFKDADQGANLWQVQSADDGDYIVALYQPEEEEKTAGWTTLLNKQGTHLQISYQGDPLAVFSSHQLGISQSEMSKVPSYLPTKLASNKKLVHYLLNQLPQSTKNTVLNKYPELK